MNTKTPIQHPNSNSLVKKPTHVYFQLLRFSLDRSPKRKRQVVMKEKTHPFIHKSFPSTPSGGWHFHLSLKLSNYFLGLDPKF